jgi:hypothetical protein
VRCCYQGIDVKEMLVGAALMDEENRNTVVCMMLKECSAT